MVLCAAAVVLVVGCGPSGGCGRGTGRTQGVAIPAGSSFRAAGDSLAGTGVVAHPALFRVYAKLRRRDRDIKPGLYLFDCRTVDWGTVLARLAEGPVVRTVTIPEGYAIKDIAPLLAASIHAPIDSVWAAMRDTALRRELDVPTPDLEGYVFPDTYRFAYGTAAREAVAQMVHRFVGVWSPTWDAQLQRLAMSRHAIITLASIIEKETRIPEERAVISAVYHNRLREQMPLQADPTVQYARGQHTARVLYKDLAIVSPYNTYRVRGLPPGPIASPGRASIVAALFPANVPYRFFVARPDGHHEFRVTFEGHTEARRAVERERRGGR
jgi:UPF0755 protein